MPVKRELAKEYGPFEPIPGYFGVYVIDVFGNVRRTCGSRCGMIKPCLRRGVLTVRLQHPCGSRKFIPVHRLVQAAYLGPVPPDKVVFHKNGDILDNCASNLAFIGRSELGKRTGFRSKAKAVMKIDADGNPVAVYRSARAAATDNFMSYQTVIDRCNGKVKSRYAPDGFRYIWDNDYGYE
jgi:hypothetical protein